MLFCMFIGLSISMFLMTLDLLTLINRFLVCKRIVFKDISLYLQEQRSFNTTKVHSL